MRVSGDFLSFFIGFCRVFLGFFVCLRGFLVILGLTKVPFGDFFSRVLLAANPSIDLKKERRCFEGGQFSLGFYPVFPRVFQDFLEFSWGALVFFWDFLGFC